MVSSKTLSNVVQSVRELVQSYWKSNSVLETNVSLLFIKVNFASVMQLKTICRIKLLLDSQVRAT